MILSISSIGVGQTFSHKITWQLPTQVFDVEKYYVICKQSINQFDSGCQILDIHIFTPTFNMLATLDIMYTTSKRSFVPEFHKCQPISQVLTNENLLKPGQEVGLFDFSKMEKSILWNSSDWTGGGREDIL